MQQANMHCAYYIAVGIADNQEWLHFSHILFVNLLHITLHAKCKMHDPEGEGQFEADYETSGK